MSEGNNNQTQQSRHLTSLTILLKNAKHLCGTVEVAKEDKDSLILRLFSFSLTINVKEWLLDPPSQVKTD
ncbi:hypothetical protein Lal_00021933 [Lupinus albus]|nr:hypothetical protein Lal_00021933 [Lupinus albus]